MSRSKIVSLLAVALLLAAPRPALSQDWIYYAQPGDTLWDLCLQYTAKRGCWMTLAQHNSIVEDRNIQPGDKIGIPVAWLLEVPIVGAVLNVTGDVQYKESDMSEWLPLLQGQSLLLGSVIRTELGSANISLGSHSEVLVRAQTTLELNTMSVGNSPGQTTKLNLPKGDVEVEVEPRSRSRFEIHTPSAIAAVRGTQYRVSAESPAATRSEVLSGLVAVQAGAEVKLPAGYGLRTRQGEKMGEPRKLLPPPQFSVERINSTSPIDVVWASQPDAVVWQLDLYAADGHLLQTRSTSENQVRYEGLEIGCYQLVARGVDSEGFQGIDGQLPLCVEAMPEVLPEPVAEESFWDFLLWLALATAVLL